MNNSETHEYLYLASSESNKLTKLYECLLLAISLQKTYYIAKTSGILISDHIKQFVIESSYKENYPFILDKKSLQKEFLNSNLTYARFGEGIKYIKIQGVKDKDLLEI